MCPSQAASLADRPCGGAAKSIERRHSPRPIPDGCEYPIGHHATRSATAAMILAPIRSGQRCRTFIVI